MSPVRLAGARLAARLPSAALGVLALLLVCACNRGCGGDAAQADAAPLDGVPSDVDLQAVPGWQDGALGDATGDAPSTRDGASSETKTAPSQPFGAPRAVTRASCSGVTGSGRKHRVAEEDMKTAFADGDDLLALANRAATGALGADYAPSDLVDLRNGKPLSAKECERYQCLRKDAAAALGELMKEMRSRGFPGKVESAFRSFGAQCGTFLNWAKKSDFCEATEQSALPGHSQHQLGTTVDLFTEEWAKDPRGVFREGFGCTPPGKFLQEHAWDFGFVMPYPIHPDDRHPKQKCVVRWDIPVNINPKTGYRFEHWHIRYVGKEAALRFKAAVAASGPGTPDEITLEQWLRRERGIRVPDADLPVCDGCNCGACTTLAPPGEGPCAGRGAIHLDENGLPRKSSAAPTIAGVRFGHTKKWPGPVLEVKLDVPAGVYTQTPVCGPEHAGYDGDATFQALAPYPETAPRAFAPIAGAWVVAIDPDDDNKGAPAWRYRAAIVDRGASVGRIYNRATVLLPASEGSVTVRVPLPKGLARVKVAVLADGVAHGERVVDAK
ncbi:MAG: M15 family metallopeptidase [Myxococcales bacterium]|nr:M15 family metallopeptidase [Myxococcales bacterium]